MSSSQLTKPPESAGRKQANATTPTATGHTQTADSPRVTRADGTGARGALRSRRISEGLVGGGTVRLRERLVEIEPADGGGGRGERLAEEQTQALADGGHAGGRLDVAGRGQGRAGGHHRVARAAGAVDQRRRAVALRQVVEV